MRSRRGELMWDNAGGLILALIIVGALVAVGWKLLSPMTDEEEGTGKSYIKVLEGEVEKAGAGTGGSFKMGPLDDIASYLIYFGGRASVETEYSRKFLAPIFDLNLICVCVWGEKVSCDIKQCTILKHPAELIGSNINGASWWVGEGKRLSIAFDKENKKYIFAEDVSI